MKPPCRWMPQGISWSRISSTVPGSPRPPAEHGLRNEAVGAVSRAQDLDSYRPRAQGAKGCPSRCPQVPPGRTGRPRWSVRRRCQGSTARWRRAPRAYHSAAAVASGTASITQITGPRASGVTVGLLPAGLQPVYPVVLAVGTVTHGGGVRRIDRQPPRYSPDSLGNGIYGVAPCYRDVIVTAMIMDVTVLGKAAQGRLATGIGVEASPQPPARALLSRGNDKGAPLTLPMQPLSLL